ncbi:GNAT family N-acetyltransferase [Vallitalea maricola]|uniref:GNAT family N-acetyltransferase n=1 Tax=Vallitalea maricola TaxID=3074433 RepID=A0ACB5UNM9_9FIRM|nr:GNAT family N-acetyltransferase [Vallitalea sp. AN17-2]
MFELKEQDFGRIKPLIDNISHSRALIFSVVEGNLKGRIFVDNMATPKTAFIEGEFLYLVGFEDNTNFNKKLIKYIFDEKIPKSKDKELILFLCSDKWMEIDKMFKKRGCITIQRKTFSFDVDKYKEVRNRYDKITYKDEVKKIKDTSNFGFRIVNNEEIISECMSIAVGSGEAEININTKEAYRRKGYATTVAMEFIDYCISNELIPNWSCWPFRKESINLAKKLGFNEKSDIPAIYWAKNM